MAVFPVHPVMWSGLLVLWFLQSAETQGYGSDFCQMLIDGDYENSAGLESDEEPFICLLYPTNELNCSWAFDTSETETQLSACISVCGTETQLDSTNCTSVKKVGWMSLALGESMAEVSEVILHLNLYQHNNRTPYTSVYDMDTLELLSPPPNIYASFSNGVLTVTWGLPHTRKPIKLDCFEYELDMCDQEGPKHLVGLHNYTEVNADPAQINSVRMRTRILKKYCSGSLRWSDWSDPVKVSMELPVSPLSPLVITFICLGIPMILLAVLLFVRYQRVTKILFPPIPRPPPKYKYFLEKSDTFNFFYPATTAKAEEEITQVEDAEKPPERAE